MQGSQKKNLLVGITEVAQLLGYIIEGSLNVTSATAFASKFDPLGGSIIGIFGKY